MIEEKASAVMCMEQDARCCHGLVLPDLGEIDWLAAPGVEESVRPAFTKTKVLIR